MCSALKTKGWSPCKKFLSTGMSYIPISPGYTVLFQGLNFPGHVLKFSTCLDPEFKIK